MTLIQTSFLRPSRRGTSRSSTISTRASRRSRRRVSLFPGNDVHSLALPNGRYGRAAPPPERGVGFGRRTSSDQRSRRTSAASAWITCGTPTRPSFLNLSEQDILRTGVVTPPIREGSHRWLSRLPAARCRASRAADCGAVQAPDRPHHRSLDRSVRRGAVSSSKHRCRYRRRA